MASIALVLLVALSAAQKAPPPPPVTVFVTSVGAKQGLTDPNKDNRDSVNDLAAALRGFKKDVRIVKSAAEATIVLTVQSREMGQMTGGMMGQAPRERKVRAVLKFRDVESELSGSAQFGNGNGGGPWTMAAQKLANQVRDWIIENREALSGRQ